MERAGTSAYVQHVLHFPDVDEVANRLRALSYEDEGTDSSASFSERLSYKLENLAEATPNVFFYTLFISTAIAIVFFSLLLDWMSGDWSSESTWTNMFMAFQLVTTFDTSEDFTEPGQIIFYIGLVLWGLVMLAVLISMITESFHAFMGTVVSGNSKVPLSGHTLILGWNETTVRVVCQLAFLRRQWRKQNETCLRRCCPWMRTKPSTPVAEMPIVILANHISKAEMVSSIEFAFSEHSISRRRTCIGRDVICRAGDPTTVKDLQRVGAHRARSILVQMTHLDDKEETEHDGAVRNGMTLRTLLALRMVMCSAGSTPRWNDLRVVTQLSKASKHLQGLSLGHTAIGLPILKMFDLTLYLNNLLFKCITQPGIAFSLLALLNFDGAAFRVRKVSSFPDSGANIIGMQIKDMATLWENAVLIGVINESCLGDDNLPDTEGMAPNHHRRVGPADQIIFASETSLPRLNKRSFPTIRIGPNTSMTQQDRELNILICGWRVEWDVPARFAFRLDATAGELPAGSEIIFLCMKDAQERISEKTSKKPSMHSSRSSASLPNTGISFSELMQEVCLCKPEQISVGAETSTWWYNGKVKIRHIRGDAAVYENLETVMKTERIDKVMVLSTMSHKQMSGFSRDTRLMTVMMGLRQMQSELDQDIKNIHVIGENAMDATSMLCMGPGDGGIPDFVNVHAIYASALAQSLAYPAMQTQISHLLTPAPGSPRLKLLECLSLIPEGEWLFGSIVQAVKKVRAADILLGVRKRLGKSVIAPALSERISCEQGDMLILMTRETSNKHRSSLQDPGGLAFLGSQLPFLGRTKASVDAGNLSSSIVPGMSSVSDVHQGSSQHAESDPQANLLALEISNDLGSAGHILE